MLIPNLRGYLFGNPYNKYNQSREKNGKNAGKVRGIKDGKIRMMNLVVI